MYSYAKHMFLRRNKKRISTFWSKIDWLCCGLIICQPLWVVLCCLPEKGRIEETVKEMKERDREESDKWMKVKKQKKYKHSPSTLTSCKDSRPCPAVSLYKLDAPMMLLPYPTTPLCLIWSYVESMAPSFTRKTSIGTIQDMVYFKWNSKML